MGPIGMPEMIMIVIVILILAIPVGIVIAVVWFFTSRNKTSQPPIIRTSLEDRLLEIDALRSGNLISEAEYEEKRKLILNRI